MSGQAGTFFDLYTRLGSGFWFVAITVFLATVIGHAFLGAWLAAEKGRMPVLWFWLCFFFGISALLALGFASSGKTVNAIQKRTEPHKPDMSVTWKCPKCGTENANNTFSCKECGYKLA